MTSERGHILTVTGTIDDDAYEYSVECLNPDLCGGWQECDQPHEVSGISAAGGPYAADESDPWCGVDEFEFHGTVHTWQFGRWTVPYPGCVVAGNDAVCDSAWDILAEHGQGRYVVDDDWYDEHSCLLLFVSRAPEPGEGTARRLSGLKSGQ